MAFVVVLAIATLLAAYRVGYERGRRFGPVVPATLNAHSVYDREYDVADIVRSEADATLLINAIQENVEPDSWDSAGGYGEVVYVSKSGTLTLSHVLSGHLSVIRYLGDVREYNTGSAADLEAAVRDANDHWLSKRDVGR